MLGNADARISAVARLLDRGMRGGVGAHHVAEHLYPGGEVPALWRPDVAEVRLVRINVGFVEGAPEAHQIAVLFGAEPGEGSEGGDRERLLPTARIGEPSGVGEVMQGYEWRDMELRQRLEDIAVVLHGGGINYSR